MEEFIMTTNERTQAAAEWLKTVKPGDEVCVTNKYNVTKYLSDLFNTMVPTNLQNEKSGEDICHITTIRAVLEDGSVVVGNKLFNSDGTLAENTPMSGNPSLHPVTDELRTLEWRYKFYKAIEGIGWEKVSDETISAMIDLINKETVAKQEAAEKEKQEKEEQAAREAEERKNNAVDIANSMVSTINNTMSENIITTNVKRCPDCPNHNKEEENKDGN